MTDTPANPDEVRTPASDDQERLLTTGQAAKVIGFRTTRRQVIFMVDNGEIGAIRADKGKWARIPYSEALRKRREIEHQLQQLAAQAPAPDPPEDPDPS